ncbi:hypothetical protein [Glaciimonas sp. PAMC28666]|uniref:hypothetical protein n=1 Tax=Glaciimonas sp. PAMC28666 TaxID=2807626 RepID=UPI001964035A|nr:hypothetical protein [Glaciimonas sp. PAMC28666]QRX83999.1 hypothetical protein JQN73_07265 [Glaciimonas sp. PAMC28666]
MNCDNLIELNFPEINAVAGGAGALSNALNGAIKVVDQVTNKVTYELNAAELSADEVLTGLESGLKIR